MRVAPSSAISGHRPGISGLRTFLAAKNRLGALTGWNAVAPGTLASLGGDTVLSSHAKEYQAFARECLEMAEKASCADLRLKLIELSRQWMGAASAEEPRQVMRTPRIALRQGKLVSGPPMASLRRGLRGDGADHQ
jgi:hypothetical protein